MAVVEVFGSMRRSITSLAALFTLSSLLLLGCTDDPPTPTEVRSQISSDLGNVLHEANASFAGSQDAVPGSTTMAVVDRVLGTDTALGARVRAIMAPVAARRADAAPAPAPSNDLIDADAAISYLDDELFTDANHVGNGVYQVPASLVCSRTSVDPSGNPVAAIDPTCAAQLAKVDLRIRVARDGGALVFAIQVDADHDEPLRFTLTHTSLAVTVDLDGAQHAFVALAALLGADVPNVALAGQVTGTLEVLGTAKARASLAIDRALSIAFAQQGADLGGPDAFVLSSAKADAFSVTFDGGAKAGSLAVGLDATTVKLPQTGGKRFELDLPGATAQAAFAAGQPLRLTHLGLGGRTTTVSISGVRAETVDLNPDDGRALDATLTQDATTGALTLAVTPKLDLQRSIDHAVLGDTPPVYDVTRVVLDGSLIQPSASGPTEVTGSLGVTTSPASYGFTASAGQCVTAADAIDPTTGASFTRWTVAACP
jgi:hypothetical protein